MRLLFAALAVTTLMVSPAHAQAWGGGVRLEDNVPTGQWMRSDETNAMSDKTTTWFTVASNESFDIPQTVGPNLPTQSAYLSVGSVEGNDEVEVRIDHGYINCLGSFTTMRFRFGSARPHTVQCDIPAAGLTGRVRVNGVGPIIQNLRRNQPLTVEFMVYGSDTPVVVTFPAEGFQWPRRGRFY